VQIGLQIPDFTTPDGPARLGAYRAGDGAASVAVELVGEHATLTLTLVVDPASGVLRQADLFP